MSGTLCVLDNESEKPDCILINTSRSIVNEAAAASPVQPIVNMGQGFLYVPDVCGVR